MKKLLQINVTANQGSTGKIAEQIGNLARDNGWESWMAYARNNLSKNPNLIRIGNSWDVKLHGLETRLFDNHGLASRKATAGFINQIKALNPSLIHLHVIHGYYINYIQLFEFLKDWGGPVVWTMHDCWAFTGHCANYDKIRCQKWKTGCYNCKNRGCYPSSLFLDNSKRNYNLKKRLFTSLNNLTLIPVSDWLAGELKQSFLKKFPILTIHNGIDLSLFKPDPNSIQTREKFGISNGEKLVLGVSNGWKDGSKLRDFIKLRSLLPNNIKIILIGLARNLIKTLPEGIIGIERTDSTETLIKLYSAADVFVYPTHEDNFPTVILESLACGTPVITYNTGGTPEGVTPEIGIVVKKGDVNAIAANINKAMNLSRLSCRQHAELMFNNQDRFNDYIKLYESLT